MYISIRKNNDNVFGQEAQLEPGLKIILIDRFPLFAESSVLL